MLVALVGCKVSGGGWIDSNVEGKKATYGFCLSEVDGVFAGTFNFNDHGTKTKFHGTIDSYLETPTGVVTVSGPTSDGGSFTAVLIDSGATGRLKFDSVNVVYSPPEDPVYVNIFNLTKGGNIKVDSDNDASCEDEA